MSINRSRRKKKYFDREGNLVLRPYTTTDLCKIYGMSFPTFQKRFKPIKKKTGKKTGYFFSVNQVSVITEAWGTPYGNPE